MISDSVERGVAHRRGRVRKGRGPMGPPKVLPSFPGFFPGGRRRLRDRGKERQHHPQRQPDGCTWAPLVPQDRSSSPLHGP